MLQRAIIVLALAVYVFVVGCAVVDSKSAAEPVEASKPHAPARFPATQATGLPYKAIGMQIQRVDWIDKYKESIDEIADVGANAVKFVVDARQEHAGSTRIYLDMRMSPTPEKLSELIRYAKSKNLRVILMPIVLLDNPRKPTEWRGRIEPDHDAGGWDGWWKSYRDMLTHFSWIAEGNGVDVLVVGSELVSTERQTGEWLKTLEQIRGVYHGQLTYSANWDHYTTVQFWDQLDFIGMNSYWKLGKNNQVTKDEIKANWAKIQDELFAFQSKIGRPILFTEVGWCSMANMAHQPWDYTLDEREAPTDLDLQKRLYEGFFESWYGKPQLGGFNMWEWTPGDGGPKDRGYTPEGKPAEKVLREWMEKKW